MSYVSRKELKHAYEDCIRKKRGTDNAINFEINDNEELEQLYKELNTKTYQIGKSIVFNLTDEQGNSRREVFAADFKDRVVHHLLCNRLVKTFNEKFLIDDNYACREGKGVLYGAQRCQMKLKEASKNGTSKNLYIFKGDFKNFFNSLNKEKMFLCIEQFIRKEFPNDRNLEFNIWLLKLIIMHCPQKSGNYIRKQPKRFWINMDPIKTMFKLDDNHGLAVGNLTSQIFANFFLGIFDLYVTQKLGYKWYGRYVDDFYIFFEDKEKFMKDFQLMCEFAKNELDLEISKKKFYLQYYKKGLKFIGYQIHWNRLYICNSAKSRFYRTIHEIATVVDKRFENGKFNITLKTAERIMPSWNSYIGILSHVKGRNIINHVMKKNPKLINEMRKVFEFDRNGYIRLNKIMKEFKKKNMVYGFKKISVYSDENQQIQNISFSYK